MTMVLITTMITWTITIVTKTSHYYSSGFKHIDFLLFGKRIKFFIVLAGATPVRRKAWIAAHPSYLASPISPRHTIATGYN
jgi:hypothetical protein